MNTFACPYCGADIDLPSKKVSVNCLKNRDVYLVDQNGPINKKMKKNVTK